MIYYGIKQNQGFNQFNSKIKERKKGGTKMKKSDLRNGMVVEMRNKLRLLVIDDKLLGQHISIKLKDYKDELRFELCDKYGGITLENLDIMKVYPVIYDLKEVDRSRIPLWERRETPRLTSDEIAILRNIDKRYIWIARDKNGILYIYDSVPEKRGNYKWSRDTLHVDILSNLSLFSHMFNFIKWTDDEPYNINDLLDSMQEK